MCSDIKNELLENKNDLIEDTFCYSLFENSIFKSDLLVILIEKSKNHLRQNRSDIEVRELLEWIVNCVNQCFLSHKDPDDLYYILNYSNEIEGKWYNEWSIEMKKMIDNS